MTNAMTMPTEGQLSITIPRRRRMSSYERSLCDLDEGRVYKYDSLDDLIKEIEGTHSDLFDKKV